MDNRHIIEEAVFDISFDSTRAASEQEAGLGSFIQGRLLPLADEIFAEISADGMDSRIDLLEIDLGDISYSGFMEEMESRFAERLKEALQDKLRSFQVSHSPTEGRSSKIQTERERLQRFLDTGHMAWRDDHHSPHTAGEMLQRVIVGDGAAFVAFLRTAPSPDITAKRLARQFPEAGLSELMRLLAPGQENRWEERIETIWKSWNRNLKGVAEKEFKASVWESLIGEHIKRGSVRDEKKLFDETIRLAFIQHATSQGAHAWNKAKTYGPNSAAPQTQSPLNERALLRSHLVSALAQGLVGNLNGKWEQIKTRHPDLIRESCAQWLKEENARAKVAQGFPEAVLFDIVRILAPTEIGFIEALADALRDEEPAMANGKHIPMWEHTLGHLCGSERFDRSAYAEGLLGKFAGYPEAKTLLDVLRTADPQLAHELSAQTHLTTQGGTAQAEAGALHQAARHLPGFQTGAEAQTGTDIGSLSGPDAKKRIEARIVGQHGSLQNDFWREIEAHGQKAQDQQRYYQRVLDDLLHGRIVDLEAATEEGQESSPSPATAQAESPLNEQALLRSHLDAALTRGPGHLDGKWSDLTKHHPGLIRESYARWMGDASTCARVAERFPEAMLLDIVRILAPEGAGFMGALSGGLRSAEPGTANGTSARLWKHTLRYLHQNERFDRRAYTQNLLRELAAHPISLTAALRALTAADPRLAAELSAQRPAAARTGAGQTGARMSTLTIEQAKTRIKAHITQALGGLENDFWREIEAHAGKTPNELSYYQRVLDDILHDRIVDLEGATGQVQASAPSPASSKAGGAQGERVLSRSRLDAALAQGSVGALGGGWNDLRQNHPDLIRESYAEHMGDESARAQLAEGFPEAMLLDIVHILAPAESGLIKALSEALRGAPPGAANGKNLYLWTHTLKHLHESQTIDRRTYAQGLLRQLAAHPEAQTAAFRALETAAPQLAAELKAGLASQRHPDAQGGIHQSGADTSALSAQDARTRIEAHIIQNHGTLENDFWREIEAHAAKAPNRQRYYQRVLDALLHERVVDLEEALGAGQEPHREAPSSQTGTSLNERDRLPARLDSALVQGLPGNLDGNRENLKQNHPDLIRENYLERMGEESARLADELNAQQHPGHQAGADARSGTDAPQPAAQHRSSVETVPGIATLSAEHARQRVKVHIIRRHGTLESDFWREIEAHARKAQSQQRYFQHILGCLLHDRIVDLEAAMAASREAEAFRETEALAGAQGRPETRGPDRNETASGEESHREERRTFAGPEAHVSPAKPALLRPAFSLDNSRRDEHKESAEEIYIANAGLVLLAPYMPQLFRMLGMSDGQRFQSDTAAERAIHLLQFAANESCDSPEFLLPLNKILCGVPGNAPICGEIEIQDNERETIEDMLKAVIQQWTIIGNTSVQGLRESFLQRGGRLQSKAESWKLKVEPKGIDVLLDRLPWSFSVIKHPWMTQPIHVEWR